MFCYIYLDPRKPGRWETDYGEFLFEPIYVGIGSGNRHLDHLKRRDVHPFTAKLKSLKRAKINPTILMVRENLTTEEAKKIEIELIARLGRRCLDAGPLLNLTGGGDGNFDPPPEVRKKLASRGFLGKHHTSETKRAISAKNAQHPTARERGRQLGKNNLGRIHSPEVNAKKGKSGALNSRAKTWMIEDDAGNFEIVHGQLKRWCDEHATSVYRFSSKVKKIYAT
jgi:hypothetical protein